MRITGKSSVHLGATNAMFTPDTKAKEKKNSAHILVLPPWIQIYMKPQNFVGSGSALSNLKSGSDLYEIKILLVLLL
jgi:hypothetical protein